MPVSARSLPAAEATAGTDDELIARWIEPAGRTADEARVAPAGARVFRVVAEVELAGGDAAAAGRAYGLPPEAVAAALAYYRRHRPVIDARITLDRAWSGA